ncbi:hypothetical protein [Prosthecobacter sp.]|uniref:hypothetical protein n=1 Tax=Prosthecobacter sp. TaxID=1965333 RepID=UPI003785065F
MPYTTNITTKWFPDIRDSLPGLELTIRGDGSYDGDYQLLKRIWLIERAGEQKQYSNFDDLWRELSPTPEDVSKALVNSESDFLHMLSCGLECGRPISRHPLWDGFDLVSDYRDPVVKDGVLAFYVYECRGLFEYPSPFWRRIERIRFKIADGSFSREHVLDLPPRNQQGLGEKAGTESRAKPLEE